jgi:hypothetical protein
MNQRVGGGGMTQGVGGVEEWRSEGAVGHEPGCERRGNDPGS